MALSDAPFNATHESIGKLVSIQVFHKDSNDDIEPESLCKYIGVLEAVVILIDQFGFKLHGCDTIFSEYKEELVEIYIQN